MEKFVVFLVLTVMLTSSFFFLSSPVYADSYPDLEVIDWANLDWDSVDWENFDWNSVSFDELDYWLFAEASLSEQFRCYRYLPECFTLGAEDVFVDLFLDDPLSFIRALAKEDSVTQESIINALPVYMYYQGYNSFPELVGSVELTDADSTETYHVLNRFKDKVEEYWGIEIPRTADPVSVFAALFVLSATGAGVMLSRKKEC